MKYLAVTYTDFIKFDRKPNEDFYLVSQKYPIFAIADGVTQAHFESGGYAFPLGSRAAAQIFCYTVSDFLETNLTLFVKRDRPNIIREIKELIEESFNLANQRIRELNKNEGICQKLDYFLYDYFDTVGVVGVIWKDSLFYGYVGDSGLVIFDRKNNLRFQTEDGVEPALKKARERYPDWENLTEAQKTKIFHRDFRNNPSGNGYGSFSGEEGVKKYYKIDYLIPNLGDLIVFYSDGFASYFQFPEFIEILRKGDKKALDDFTLSKAKENYKKFGTDRTLITFVYR